MEKHTYIHEIKLPEKDDFSRKFNYISWLLKMACDETLTKEQQEFYSNEHFDAKLNLEQGNPVSFLNEYSG